MSRPPPTRAGLTFQMPVFVYLDQKDFGALLEPENAALRSEVRDWTAAGDVVIPLSLIHFIETSKAEPGLRSRLFELMLELSGGLLLRGIPQLVELEASAAGRRAQVRDGLLSTSFFDMVGAASPMPMTLETYLAATNSILPSRQVHEVVEKTWEGQAAAINTGREDSDTLLKAYRRAFGSELRESDLPALRQTHPHLAVTHALQMAIFEKVPTGLTGHDIGDTVALGSVLPYFDVVGLDRRMFARVGDAKAAIADLQRAHIERRVHDLVDAIGSALMREGG